MIKTVGENEQEMRDILTEALKANQKWARKLVQNIQALTPADQGTIAATMDDAHRMGLGDDCTVDQVYFTLTSECSFSHSDAEYHAYRAVHGC